MLYICSFFTTEVTIPRSLNLDITLSYTTLPCTVDSTVAAETMLYAADVFVDIDMCDSLPGCTSGIVVAQCEGDPLQVLITVNLDLSESPPVVETKMAAPGTATPILCWCWYYIPR